MGKVHRFFVGDDLKLKKDFWVHDEALLWQWGRVLRMKEGSQIILFDGQQTDRLYKIEAFKKTEVHLVMVTELKRVLPKKNIYLFWSVLKRDNNDHVLQKATELGVSHFVPIITERTIKKDFNITRARKIVTEASEQCGRSNIPQVREPIHLEKALDEYQDKIKFYVCQHGTNSPKIEEEKVGLLIGPEGGWTPDEMKLFESRKYEHIGLSEFVLRAENSLCSRGK